MLLESMWYKPWTAIGWQIGDIGLDEIMIRLSPVNTTDASDNIAIEQSKANSQKLSNIGQCEKVQGNSKYGVKHGHNTS